MPTSNPWIEFLKEQRGSGLSVTDLRDLYLSRSADADPIYIYDNNADVKHNSLLESLKQDPRVFPDGIAAINKKLELKQLDSITPKEAEAWRLVFEMALTNDYTLTKQQLLGSSYDWWINRLIQEGDIDSEDVDEIIERLSMTQHRDIYEFLDDVLASFTLEQLYSIGQPELE